MSLSSLKAWKDLVTVDISTFLQASEMACQLTALANIISTEVHTLTETYCKAGLELPRLDDPYVPSALDFDPTLVETRALIIAAAAQLLAAVRLPFQTLEEVGPGMYFTAILGFVVDVNIPDILQEAGSTGLHVKDICAKNGVDPSYIARVLRFLATRHIFREVSPDVFANNRISSVLTKGKSLEEIQSDPVARFDGAPLAAFISSTADEASKSSVFLSSFLQNSGTDNAPFNIALETKAKMWDWYEEPGNEWRARRFSAGMKGGAERFNKKHLINAIVVSNLKEDDVIVDVGSSIGTMTHTLYEAMPQYRYVVQDLEKQIIGAKQFWDAIAPDAILSGRVELQAHDFFNPQPIKAAALYFLRVVIHDWPDHEAKIILRHLRDAASASSKLIIFDMLAIHTSECSAITCASGREVPYPLLPNLGIAGAGFVTGLDIQMMNLFNGKERTEAEFRELGEATGWKLESIIKDATLPCFFYSAV